MNAITLIRKDLPGSPARGTSFHDVIFTLYLNGVEIMAGKVTVLPGRLKQKAQPPPDLMQLAGQLLDALPGSVLVKGQVKSLPK